MAQYPVLTPKDGKKKYFEAIRKGRVVLVEGKRLVASVPQTDGVVKIIIQDGSFDDDLWYGFMQLPVDLFIALIHVSGEEMMDAICNRVFFYLEAIIGEGCREDVLIEYSISYERAEALYDEKWPS